MPRNLDPEHRETAIRVLMGTKLVMNYVDGELRFLEVDRSSQEYANHRQRIAREYATKIIDERRS